MTRKSAASASPGLLDDLKSAGIKPALAIIGEPTLMKIVGAHKGGAKLVTRAAAAGSIIPARRKKAPMP